MLIFPVNNYRTVLETVTEKAQANQKNNQTKLSWILAQSLTRFVSGY